MSKPKLLFRGPCLTSSGYGVHARQIMRALINSDKFDLSVQSTKWGDTPFLTDDGEFIDSVRKLALKGEQEIQSGQTYDISVQVTIPNEFTKLARINVGVTAGIEVDRVTPEWIKKCNENVDLVVVPSKHSADTFTVKYQSQDGKETLQLSVPLMVVPEGVDTTIFNTIDELTNDRVDLSDCPDFNFLCVGLGFDKGLGEDRKNISNLVKYFYEKFKNPKVGLILKVGLVNNSLLDFEATKRRINDLREKFGDQKSSRVKLIHGRLSDRQMAALYRDPKVGAFITLTHGEGFGLPLIEAAACGLPIMATNWSGHLDFLSIGNKLRFIPLDFDLKEIPPSVHWKDVMDPGSRWAEVRENDVKLKMAKIALNSDAPRTWALELSAHIGDTFNQDKVYLPFIQTLLEGVHSSAAPASEDDFVANIRSQLAVTGKSLIYTMPMSAGDVYISTAVIDSLRKKYPNHKIFFATGEKYASILLENPNIDQIIQFQDWMMNVPLLHRIFDEVYTPNLAIQTIHANWVRGGKGRSLGQEMAAQCDVDFGDYFIKMIEAPVTLPNSYICLNPGSGKGQWEARNYLYWQDVVNNLKRITKLDVVQVGMTEDPLYEGVIDLRGKTSYNQLADVIKRSRLTLGIDSLAMHLAAGLNVNYVSIFGSSYPTSTGPSNPKSLGVLLETPSRYTCEKACYKYQCSVDKEHPCLNEIEPKKIVQTVVSLLQNTRHLINPENSEEYLEQYAETPVKISGYTHLLNPTRHGYPWANSITSMLGFCDEVVVVDGGSDDGTLADLKQMADVDNRIKIFEREWDPTEPGMDGMQKAYARALCSYDYLWQQDADEIVHEDDYEKIRKLVKRFPKNVDLIDLPVVELWGSDGAVRTDRHAWKWRLSKNNFRITHGINKDARLFDKETGKTYSKKGMSDGCEYIDMISGEYIPHKNFYTQELENLRSRDPDEYGRRMNKIFSEMPCVYHYSWAGLVRKVKNFRDFWDKQWSVLYGDTAPDPRFPDVKTDEDVAAKAKFLKERGGEHGSAKTFMLSRTQPGIMDGWLQENAS